FQSSPASWSVHTSPSAVPNLYLPFQSPLLMQQKNFCLYFRKQFDYTQLLQRNQIISGFFCNLHTKSAIFSYFSVKPPVFTPFCVYSLQVYNILAYFAGKSAK